MTIPPDPPPNGSEREAEPTDLGAVVRMRREQLGMTQEMLAEAARRILRGISDIEVVRSQSPQRPMIGLLAVGLHLIPSNAAACRRSFRLAPTPPTGISAGRWSRRLSPNYHSGPGCQTAPPHPGRTGHFSASRR